MQYHVRMDVHLPADMDADAKAALIEREKSYSQELQRAGKWPHIWRIVGEYANYSILEADSHDDVHEMLSGLPLFPYMSLTVTALARHPSDVKS